MSTRTTYKTILGHNVDVLSPDPTASGADLLQDDWKAIADICESLAASISSAQSLLTTLQSSLTTHTSNTSNPHSVTKAQVGLGNVTNDAQLPLAGGTMGGTLDMGSNGIDAVSSVFAESVEAASITLNGTNIGEWLATLLPIDGSLSMEGSLDMNGNVITNVVQIGDGTLIVDIPNIWLGDGTNLPSANWDMGGNHTILNCTFDTGGGIIMSGSTLTMEAGTLDMEGGVIDDVSQINGTGSITGVSIFATDLSIASGAVYMDSSGIILSGVSLGMGGSTLDMDGGTISMGEGTIDGVSAITFAEGGTIDLGIGGSISNFSVSDSFSIALVENLTAEVIVDGTTIFRLATDEIIPLVPLNGDFISCNDFSVNNGTVFLHSLPTSNPNEEGRIWNDGGTLKVSAG